MEVVLYTSLTCSNCDSFVQILDHLRGEDGYTKKVINSDLEAYETISNAGFRSVPVVQIDDDFYGADQIREIELLLYKTK